MTAIVDVVVGGQYGSEAKGHVTAQLITQAARERDHENFDIDVINIRVAGPNAGHTAYDANGVKFAFRSLPIGAITDPQCILYIAPGSEIDLPVLHQEIREAEAAGHRVTGRLYMSRQATLITDQHKTTEAETGLVKRVGSTGKGIGAARADRILRTAQTVQDAFTDGPDGDMYSQPWAWAEPEDLYATDDHVHNRNLHIVIEGTQGYGLSMRASGHYPQTTSSDCRSVDFLAMAGIDPTRCNTIVQNWVVCRVNPIRVAGNSGPIKGETTWEDLGLEAEKTTVTQKVRRVGTWDPDLVRAAVQANGGHNANVVVTMLDQVVPGLNEITPEIMEEVFDGGAAVEGNPRYRALEDASAWLNEHASQDQIGAPVAAFTFSPTQIVFTRAAQGRVEDKDDIGIDDVEDALRRLNDAIDDVNNGQDN